MKELQLSIFDTEEPEKPKPVILPHVQAGEKVFSIPQDVWETRCVHCVHKNGKENWAVPLWAVHRPQYTETIPCRIMSISRPNVMPGECMSFAPKISVYGICESCRHNNIFEDRFCAKEDHAEQRRVFYGHDYGGDERKRDYWGRHRLSVCDDYEPNQYAERGEESGRQAED